MIETTDVILVEAARRGDLKSLEILYSRYYRPLVWLAFSVLGDRDLAEDAAQETFAQACQSLIRLKKPEKFASWLSAICRNVACQMVRQRKRLQFTDQVPEYLVPAQPGNDGQVEKMIAQALRQMDQRYRELLILYYFNKMSYEKIAGILDVPAHRVKSRLFRARRKMADCLDKLGFDWNEL